MKPAKVSPNIVVFFFCSLCILMLPRCGQQQTGGATSKRSADNCRYCDTNLYKRIYSKDGYVLLSVRNRDSVAFKYEKSIPIKDDTAARMIKYYLNNPLQRHHPIAIDFSITAINNIVEKLNETDTGGDEKKSLEFIWQRMIKEP